MTTEVWWNWTDAWLFIGVFVGIRIAIIWMATQFVVALIPEGDVCVTCGEQTLPLRHEGGWHMLGQRFHRRFCLSCRWEGVARSPRTPPRPSPPPPVRPRSSREPVGR